MNPSQSPYQKNDRLLKKMRWHIIGRIKIPEIEDGEGTLDQGYAR